MKITEVRWPDTPAAAVAMQDELATSVRIPERDGPPPATVAGLDVSYLDGSADVVAAAVVVDVATGDVLEERTLTTTVAFPYVPGLLAFREVPALLAVLRLLRTEPDLLLCDGQGLAHPRRFGLACHLGVLTGRPAVGCAKSRFIGTHDEPGPRRGDRAALLDGVERIGTVLRTRDGVRPVYVSPGSGISHNGACAVVLATSRGFRLPDPIRRADRISRAALAS